MNLNKAYYNLIFEENVKNEISNILNSLNPSDPNEAKKLLSSPLVQQFAKEEGIIKESNSDLVNEDDEETIKISKIISPNDKKSLLAKLKKAIKVAKVAGTIGLIAGGIWLGSTIGKSVSDAKDGYNAVNKAETTIDKNAEVINSKNDSTSKKIGKNVALVKHSVTSPLDQASSVNDQKEIEKRKVC